MKTKLKIVSGILIQIALIAVGFALVGCGKDPNFYSSIENLRPDTSENKEETQPPASADATAETPEKEAPDYEEPTPEGSAEAADDAANEGDDEKNLEATNEAEVVNSDDGVAAGDVPNEVAEGALDAAFEAGQSGKSSKGNTKNDVASSITVKKDGIETDYVTANLENIEIIAGNANECEIDDDDFVQVTGNQNEVDLSDRSISGIKIAGNKNSATIKIITNTAALNDDDDDDDDDDDNKETDSICVFVAGNQSQISIDLTNQMLDGIAIKLRGNQSTVDLLVNGDTTLENVIFDNKGNGGKVNIYYMQM